MTNDPKADAEAIAKLRAWRAVDKRRWYCTDHYSEEMFGDIPIVVSLHVGREMPVHIGGMKTIAAAVDAALKAWEKVEAEQP